MTWNETTCECSGIVTSYCFIKMPLWGLPSTLYNEMGDWPWPYIYSRPTDYYQVYPQFSQRSRKPFLKFRQISTIRRLFYINSSQTLPINAGDARKRNKKRCYTFFGPAPNLIITKERSGRLSKIQGSQTASFFLLHVSNIPTKIYKWSIKCVTSTPQNHTSLLLGNACSHQPLVFGLTGWKKERWGDLVL